MKKIMLQVSKEDWRKAKNYRRYRNLQRVNTNPVSRTCPIAQCLLRHGYSPTVRIHRAYINNDEYQLNAHAMLIVSAFDSGEKPLYGTVVFTR
jgi:hypothetical protein